MMLQRRNHFSPFGELRQMQDGPYVAAFRHLPPRGHRKAKAMMLQRRNQVLQPLR